MSASINPLGKSDHYSVNLSVNLEYRCFSDNIEMYYYDYNRADYACLNHYVMSHINWDYEFLFVFTTEE